MTQLDAVLRELDIDPDALESVPDYPEPGVLAVGVAPDRAVAAWKALRAAASQTGRWPVLIGGDPGLLAEQLEFATEDSVEVHEVIEDSWELDVAGWFEQRAEGHVEDRAAPLAFGDWEPAGGPTMEQMGPHADALEEGADETILWLIPCAHGWEVPAHLHLGGFNDMPESSVLVAVLRAWKKAHGADLYGVAHDRLELVVARPPQTRAATEALATQQYVLCVDVVDQGYETLDALASALHGAPAWWLWWD